MSEETKTMEFTPEILAELKEKLGVAELETKNQELAKKNQELETQLSYERGRREATEPQRAFNYQTQTEWDLQYRMTLAQAQWEQQQEQAGENPGTQYRDELATLQRDYQSWAQDHNSQEEQTKQAQAQRESVYNDLLRENKLEADSAEAKMIRGAVDAGLSREEIEQAYFEPLKTNRKVEGDEAARQAAARDDLRRGTIEGGQAAAEPPAGGGDQKPTLDRNQAFAKLQEAARAERRPPTFAALFPKASAKEATG